VRLDGVVFGATVYVISAGPLPPVLPMAMVSHGWLLTAVHEQPAAVVSVTVVVRPVAATVRDGGATSYVHAGVAALWVTVCTSPATVIVAVRLEVAVLAAAVYVISAGPVPPALVEATESQPSLLTAVHVQPAVVVNVTVAVAPAAATVREGGASA
jgi:hypothetical protein